jgi:NAD(P)-dependent dehydrogenase (short-subunit alcohol dehydrogenase family)
MSDTGKKVVVVGASSGIGRAMGLGLAKRGSQVAFLARRLERLEKAAAEAGDGCVAIACDVTDAAGVAAAIDAAAAALGGIDTIIYSTGIGILAKVEDLTAADWKRAFDTNVIGASLVTSAALPHLRKSKGVALYLSSISASLTPAWPGAAAYTVSKAALEKLVEAWNAEHGDVAFTRVNVGDTAGGEGESTTEFVNEWDFDFFGKVHPIWSERKLVTGTLMEVDELIDVVDKVSHLGNSVHVPIVVVTPRSNTQLFA